MTAAITICVVSASFAVVFIRLIDAHYEHERFLANLERCREIQRASEQIQADLLDRAQKATP